MTTTPNTIDTLFSLVDEINAKTAEQFIPSDIDVVIAYQRRLRAKLAAGEKPDKPKSTVDISALLGQIIKPKGPVADVFKRKL